MPKITLKNNMEKSELKNLKKRYCIWFYKSVKEAIDKIERKFSQLQIDNLVLKEMERLDRSKKAVKDIDGFRAYMVNKANAGKSLKFDSQGIKPEYYFLELKLKAVEKAIEKEFGKKFLEEVKALYEIEMTDRILKSTEH